MRTDQAIEKAGTTKALAELLEITPSAISQWGDEIPDGRYWQLRVVKPEWFGEDLAAPTTQEQGAA